MDEFDRCDFGMAIMGTNGLTDVAPPYRVKFSHQFELFFVKLTLSLSNGGEAFIALTAKYTRGAGTAAGTAVRAGEGGLWLDGTEGLGGHVGDYGSSSCQRRCLPLST